MILIPGEDFCIIIPAIFYWDILSGKYRARRMQHYLKEIFFDPLHMKNTGVHYAGIKLEQKQKDIQE